MLRVTVSLQKFASAIAVVNRSCLIDTGSDVGIPKEMTQSKQYLNVDSKLFESNTNEGVGEFKNETLTSSRQPKSWSVWCSTGTCSSRMIRRWPRVACSTAASFTV